jgi:tetratricopeptide (TPR) repeat protein
METARRSPSHAAMSRALYQYAWTRYGQGRLVDAEASLLRLLAHDPLNIRGNLLLGRLLVKAGRIEHAVARFGAITRAIPAVKESWWSLAWALMRLGRLREAAGALMRYCRVHGESAPARRLLAQLRIKMGAPGRATQDLAAAGPADSADQQRSDAEMLMTIADQHKAAGEVPEAIEAYLKASDLDPHQHRAYREMAQLHREVGEVRRARLHALELVRLCPQDVDALLLAGEVCAEAEDWDRCVALLESYLTRVPRDADARAMKARAHLKIGEASEAQAEYLHVLELVPASVEAAWNLARLAHHFQDPGAERAHLLRVLLRDPEHADALWQLSELELQSGRYRAAQRTLSRLILLRPGSSAILFKLGQIAYRVGDLPVARDHLERVARVRPRDHRVIYELGRVLLAIGQPQAARERFQQVAQLAPVSPEARMARHELEAMAGGWMHQPALLVRRA